MWAERGSWSVQHEWWEMIQHPALAKNWYPWYGVLDKLHRNVVVGRKPFLLGTHLALTDNWLFELSDFIEANNESHPIQHSLAVKTPNHGNDLRLRWSNVFARITYRQPTGAVAAKLMCKPHEDLYMRIRLRAWTISKEIAHFILNGCILSSVWIRESNPILAKKCSLASSVFDSLFICLTLSYATFSRCTLYSPPEPTFLREHSFGESTMRPRIEYKHQF